MEQIDFDNIKNSIKNLENKDLVLQYKKQHGGNNLTELVSDGYYTFGELYEHRMILSKLVFEAYQKYAWKAMKHSDGTMFEGSFVVGVSIPEAGDYSYHYPIEFFDLFDVHELAFAPEYDGHKPSDITRLLELK